ncbi:MAG: acyl-[acyl-carrier-protein] thioesterase [bacterium]
MKPVWEQTFIIRSYDVDPVWRLRLSSFFHFMQEVAVNHSYDLGVGYHDLEKYGMFWVLSRIKLIIKKMPSWGETINVITWPKGRNKLFALRDFLVVNTSNEELISATSLWLLINKNNHKPLRMQSLPVNLPENDGKHALNEQLEKIRAFEHIEQSYERDVMVEDLDVNYHVNNARYIDWILDCFDPSFLASNNIKSIQVNYTDEAGYKDRILVNISNDLFPENRLHYIECVNKNTNSPVTQAVIEWA